MSICSNAYRKNADRVRLFVGKANNLSFGIGHNKSVERQKIFIDTIIGQEKWLPLCFVSDTL